jgi:hypothetical protein
MNKHALRSTCIIVVFCLLALARTTYAGDASQEATPPIRSACLPPSDTEFRIGIPGWISGLSGDAGVRGVVADVDVPFADILKRLDMIAAGSLYARYHRWEFFADGLYMRISDDARLRGLLFGSAHIVIKDAFAEGFVGYRLFSCEQGHLSLLAGARYNYMRGDFRLLGTRLAGRRAEGAVDWVDPVVGVSGKVRAWKPVSFWTRANIGGFGAASDLTWQVQGGLKVQLTRRIYSDIGWAYFKNDYTAGGFTSKTALNGP